MPPDYFVFAEKELPDGRVLLVVPMTFGKARLTVGFGYDTYEDGW